MTEQRDIYLVSGVSLDDVNNAINRCLALIADRLDRLEGLRGNPRFYSSTLEFDSDVQGILKATGGSASFDSSVEESIDTHMAATGQDAHGLGSLSTQNSDDVNITGGSISGVSGLSSWSDWATIAIDLSSSTWNTVGTHEILTITGVVQIEIIAECTETLAGAGNISVHGESGALTIWNSTVKATITTGLWHDISAPDAIGFASPDGSTSSFVKSVLARDADIGLEILTDAATDGTLNFHYRWMAISSGATVTAGTGISL